MSSRLHLFIPDEIVDIVDGSAAHGFKAATANNPSVRASAQMDEVGWRCGFEPRFGFAYHDSAYLKPIGPTTPGMASVTLLANEHGPLTLDSVCRPSATAQPQRQRGGPP